MRQASRTELLILLAVGAAVFVWSGINPHDRTTWWLEVFPVIIAVPVLWFTRTRFPLTPLAYRLIFLHALILMLGGHYTYARVPLGFWAQELFGFARNHYDRVGHLAQGFIPAIIAREILIRTSPLRGGKWLPVVVTSICLAISAMYEFIEWWAALLGGSAATDFLGTQGDVWDTQWDMFLAFCGSILAQLLLSRVHDRQLQGVRLSSAQPSETMTKIAGVLLALGLMSSAAEAQRASAPYAPGAAWERRAAAQVGMDSAKIEDAIAFAKSREVRTPRDLEEAHYQTFGREPFGNAVGPFKARGDLTGVIVKNGYLVAEWGDPARVDMTFSVTKSFVSTMVGLAVERGLIRNIDDTVQHYMGPVLHATTPALGPEGGRGRFDARTTISPFDTPHNRKITWRHLLQQSSDFEGTLWGKPEWADRPSNQPATWWTRERVGPGTTHEYNDTRVNALALAALNVWRRPLPDVLRELVMDPISASPTWRWYGYDNSWVVLDGQLIQSVSGGGHWGGGMFISAYDQARFGLLTCRNGRWGAKQIIPESWIRLSRTGSTPEPGYGFMNFYLNTGKRRWPNASETTFLHLGNGTNAVICLPESDTVIVVRWIEGNAIDGLIQRVNDAITSGRATTTGSRGR